MDSCTAQAAGGAGQGELPPAQAAAGEREGSEGLGQAQQDTKALTAQQLTSVGCRRGNVKNVTVDQIPTELGMQDEKKKKKGFVDEAVEGRAEAEGMRINTALAEAAGVLLQVSRAAGPGTAAAGKQTWRN